MSRAFFPSDNGDPSNLPTFQEEEKERDRKERRARRQEADRRREERLRVLRVKPDGIVPDRPDVVVSVVRGRVSQGPQPFCEVGFVARVVRPPKTAATYDPLRGMVRVGILTPREMDAARWLRQLHERAVATSLGGWSAEPVDGSRDPDRYTRRSDAAIELQRVIAALREAFPDRDGEVSVGGAIEAVVLRYEAPTTLWGRDERGRLGRGRAALGVGLSWVSVWCNALGRTAQRESVPLETVAA